MQPLWNNRKQYPDYHVCEEGEEGVHISFTYWIISMKFHSWMRQQMCRETQRTLRMVSLYKRHERYEHHENQRWHEGKYLVWIFHPSLIFFLKKLMITRDERRTLMMIYVRSPLIGDHGPQLIGFEPRFCLFERIRFTQVVLYNFCHVQFEISGKSILLLTSITFR